MMRLPQPGSWYRFTPADWQFIMDTLALSDRGREGLASLTEDPHAVRHILDHPKLFEAVLENQHTTIMSPELFFLVLVRHALKGIGVEEIEVADYVAVVCANFGLPRQAASGQAPKEIQGLYSIDYIQALEKARGPERFMIHVQCANQFLVLTCLYPTFLHHRVQRRGAPDVQYYEQVVVSNLQAAGNHALAEEFALDNVLLRLADAFPPVRRAMNYALREYLFLGN